MVEVCRKCDEPYQYLIEDVELVGEDICYNCVSFRKRYRGNLTFSKMRELEYMVNSDPELLNILLLKNNSC